LLGENCWWVWAKQLGRVAACETVGRHSGSLGGDGSPLNLLALGVWVAPVRVL
jgi:hypothetical protein